MGIKLKFWEVREGVIGKILAQPYQQDIIIRYKLIASRGSVLHIILHQVYMEIH